MWTQQNLDLGGKDVKKELPKKQAIKQQEEPCFFQCPVRTDSGISRGPCEQDLCTLVASPQLKGQYEWNRLVVNYLFCGQ